MEFVTQDALKDAIVFQLFILAQSQEDWLSRGLFPTKFREKPGRRRLELALEALNDGGLIDYDKQTDRYTITNDGYEYVEEQLQQEDSFLFGYKSNSDDWLEAQLVKPELIPASDRIVARDDNQALADVEEALVNLEADISLNNEVGDFFGNDRDLPAGEIVAAKALIAQPRFRLSRLRELIVPLLKVLAEKFSTSAVGEAAKRLIDLLMDLH